MRAGAKICHDVILSRVAPAERLIVERAAVAAQLVAMLVDRAWCSTGDGEIQEKIGDQIRQGDGGRLDAPGSARQGESKDIRRHRRPPSRCWRCIAPAAWKRTPSGPRSGIFHLRTTDS